MPDCDHKEIHTSFCLYFQQFFSAKLKVGVRQSGNHGDKVVSTYLNASYSLDLAYHKLFVTFITCHQKSIMDF